IIVELGVVRVPPMIIALDEKLQHLARRVVELGGEKILFALIECDCREKSLRIVEPGIRMLIPCGEPQVVQKVVGVFGAERRYIVAAVAVGSARLKIRVGKRLIALGLIVAAVEQKFAAPKLGANIAIDVLAVIGVAAKRQAAGRSICEGLGDDVD